MGLEQLVQNGPTGLVAGYMGGAKAGADLRSSLATSGQTLAQTDRYTQETPSFLQKSRADARAAELGNMQGEADAAAGVYGAKAGVSIENAKVDALKAKQALEQMPAEHRAKYMAAIQQGNMQMLDLVEQTLTQTSDVPSTIGIIEQQYPQVTQDPSWNMEKQKVGRMAPQAALNYIREMKAKLASSDAYGDAGFQGKMIQQNAQDAAAMERTKYTADAGLRGDQIRANAAAAGSTKQNAAEIVRDLAGQAADAYKAGDVETGNKLIYQINAINKARPDEPEFAGIPGKPGNQVKPLNGAKAKTSAAWGSWSDAKKQDLLDTLKKHPDQIDRASQMFDISADWLRKQTGAK